VYLGHGANLQRAIDDAHERDRLTISGTCVGNFRSPIALRLIGQGRPGFPGAILDARDDGRVLFLRRGALIRSLLITGGRAPHAAGILSLGGVLGLRGHTVVAENHAGHGGGGIAFNGTLIATDRSVIRHNVAQFGGGIALGDDATLQLRGHAVVRNNRARDMGGGVTSNLGPIVLSGFASIRANETDGAGGGIWIIDGFVFLDGHASVVRNTAGDAGGGINSSPDDAGAICSPNVRLSPNDPDDPPPFDLSGSFC
jgi:predicted outer membrane repeat protein